MRNVSLAILGSLLPLGAGATDGLVVHPEPAGARIEYRGRAVLEPVRSMHLVGAGSAVRIAGPGLRTLASPGLPALAGEVVLLALPPGASPHVERLHAVSHDEPNVWVDPGEATPDRDPVTGEFAGGFVAELDPDVYATDAFWPAEPVTVLSRGVARDVDYALVQVIPFQWNPVRRTLRVFDRLDLRVHFQGGPAPAAAPAGAEAGGPGGGERLRQPRAGRGRAAEFAGFANGPVPQAWRGRRTAPDLPAILAGLNPDAQGEAWKVEIEADGLYRLRHSELAAAGFPTSVPIAELRLASRGKSVPVRVLDRDASGTFNLGDEIVFAGLANRERWSTTEVYWLSRAGGGAFMAERDAIPADPGGLARIPSHPAVTRLERDEQYVVGVAIDPADGDVWMTAKPIRRSAAGCTTCFTPPCEVTETLAVPALGTPEVGHAYELRGRVLARKLGSACLKQDQGVDVKLNGQLVGSVQWSLADGFAKEWALPIDPSRLVASPGVNSVELSIPAALPGAFYTYVDWIEIESPARLEAVQDRFSARASWSSGGFLHVGGFTDPDLEIVDEHDDGTAVHLDGYRLLSLGPGMPLTAVFAVEPLASGSRRVLAYARPRLMTPKAVYKDAPSTLASPANATEHLILTHATFSSAIAPLASHRIAQGMSSLVVDVQDVFDEYSWGNVDGEAIHDFLADALSRWSTPPLYVLLVGDSSHDFKNNYGLAQVGYPPASFVPYREYVSSAPSTVEQIMGSDFTYQELTGDDVPDLLLGRLPVRTPAEVTTYVQKVTRYEAQSGQSAWNRRHIFIADDDVYDAGAASGQCNPPPETEVELFLRDVSSQYLGSGAGDAVLVEERDYREGQGTAPIVNERNLGAVSTFYFGHGSILSLGATCGSSTLFFRDTHISLLTNADALPLSTTVSCDVGAFHFASPTGQVRCFGEVFTVTAPVGDIAYVGQTTLLNYALGKGQIEGMLDGMIAPGSTFLPPFLPAAEAARRAGGIHFASQMGLLRNPRVTPDNATWSARTNVLFGDPAARLLIDTD